MSQREVAESAETTQSMVSRYERGEVNPEFGTVERIVRAMGCSLTDLDAALAQARGETPLSRPPNRRPPPLLEPLRDEADGRTSEVDRRAADLAARLVREILGFDPEAPTEPASGGGG